MVLSHQWGVGVGEAAYGYDRSRQRGMCMQGYSVGGTVGSLVEAQGAGRLCIGSNGRKEFQEERRRAGV